MDIAGSGLLLNLTYEPIVRAKTHKRNTIQNAETKSPLSETIKEKIRKNDVPLIAERKITNSGISSIKQHNIKNRNSSGTGSDSQHVYTSSLFKSNPEIPLLKVDKQESISEPLFSEKIFEDVNLHSYLVSCLKNRLEVISLTKVQEKTIPVLLDGRDCLVKSCTGSGKTLAYAVPIVQKLQEISPKIKRSDGVFCLIVVPTRELALQCFQCFSTLTKAFVWIVPGYLIGGEKKKSEKDRLRKGVNILISTPGRLLDHLESTSFLYLGNIQWLVIDEADRLLEQGFEESITKILSKCQQSRQTVLLSATLSKGVERLAGMSLTDPVNIDIASGSGITSESFQEFVLPSTLKQSIVVVPSKLRLTVMSAFIVDKFFQTDFKGLIFMCSQSSVDFHFLLLTNVLSPLLTDKGQKCKFFKLHGQMAQEERTEIFTVFRAAKQGILLCTDVAARGLDLPHVDWIMQYSVPLSTEIYVHRVGRTARIGKKGSALLFLLPSEVGFSKLLNQHKIQFEEMDVNKILQSLLLIRDSLTTRAKISPEECATALQSRYEKDVYDEESLHESASDAFHSYIRAYSSYPKQIRDILPFNNLHLGHVAKSFCLREAPSELGSHLQNAVRNSKHFRNEKQKPQKRKSQAISEFDSGFSYLKPKWKKKKVE